MPEIGDAKPVRIAADLAVGSVIHSPLLDEKKGHYRRVTHVRQRTGLVGFRTVDHPIARPAKDAPLDEVQRLRDNADQGGEWFELPRGTLVP